MDGSQCLRIVEGLQRQKGSSEWQGTFTREGQQYWITVKATAVDTRMTRTWDNQLAGYVAAGFRVTRLANIGQHGVQLVQKLVTVATLWLGARLVIDGDISVGQLIAFISYLTQILMSIMMSTSAGLNPMLAMASSRRVGPSPEEEASFSMP